MGKKPYRGDTVTYSEADKAAIKEKAAAVRAQYPWMTEQQAGVFEVISRWRGENGLSENGVRYLFECVMKVFEEDPVRQAVLHGGDEEVITRKRCWWCGNPADVNTELPVSGGMIKDTETSWLCEDAEACNRRFRDGDQRRNQAEHDEMVKQMTERTPEGITEGIEKAREALAEGDAAVVAYLLDVPAEDVRRICSEK